MIGCTVNTRGRYKCNFCDHTTYKTTGGIQQHLKDQHLHSLRLALKDAEIERLKNRPAKVIEKERIVYRDAPKPKTQEYWDCPVFCVGCKELMAGGRIPRGQTVEETPHSRCGTRSLVPILRGL